MRLKLTSSVYGAWSGKPGEIVDRPVAEAKKLIAGGYAVPLQLRQPTAPKPTQGVKQ